MKTGSLNTGRASHAATLLPNGLVLVTGGADNIGVLAGCELYNPGTRTWIITGGLNTARLEHTATLLPNGLLLLAGGYSSNGDSLAAGEFYYCGFGPSPAIQPLDVGLTLTAQMVNGLFTLNFTNLISLPFSVLTTTNVALPAAAWSTLGDPTELSPGQYQFIDSQLPTAPQLFYQVVSPGP